MTKNDFAETVQLGQTKSDRWRVGYLACLSGLDASVGQHFARSFGLPDALVPNASTSQRIFQAEQFLFEDPEKLEGHLSCWLERAREEFQLVMWAQAEVRQPGSPQLRQAMYRFLNDGKLD